MKPEVYELVAMFMRYWFVFLMLMIVFRCCKWLYNERKKYLRTLRYLPDAGFIGEAVDMETGKSYPLAREGVIGSGRHADIRIRAFKRLRVYFELEEGLGVRLEPVGGNGRVTVDGESIQKEGYALHQSLMETPVGSVRFRLFEGVNVPAQAFAGGRRDALGAEEDAWAADAPLQQTFPPPAYYQQAYGEQAYPPQTYQTGNAAFYPLQEQYPAASAAFPACGEQPPVNPYPYPVPGSDEPSARQTEEIR